MSEIKIRTIPRSNEQRAPSSETEARRIGLYLILLSLSALCLGIFGFLTSREPIERTVAKSEPVVDQTSAAISRHMYDTHLKEALIKRRLQMENRVTAPRRLNMDAEILPEDKRSYGVQLDQDDSAEKLYKELNTHQNSYGDNLDEKINQRLANRKWLNEQERAERIVFIKNFIRSAYERGYEVQIDSNLVVTGVRKVSNPKSFNIEQVLDRIAKQGY